MVGALPRVNEEELSTLLDQLAKNRLPAYSLMGADDVEQGALLSSMPAENWQQLTRRIALNLQSVLLGDSLADLPVLVDGRRRLTLNMETARRVGVSPPFEVMLEAHLLRQEPEIDGPTWTLDDVARTAIAENLSARAAVRGVEAGQQIVKERRSLLLPQLDFTTSYLRVDPDSRGVASGAQAESLADASVSLNQILWDESTWANLAIERLQQSSREEEAREIRLDIVQAATVAFLDVLQARTKLDIQRESLALTRANLDLAHERVRVGYATQADVYRWQSELARDQADLLEVVASVRQAEETLNQQLNRPLDERFRVEPASADDPTLLMNDPAIAQWIGDPVSFERLASALIGHGLERAPEIAQFDAQVAAQERLLRSERRAFWSPTLNLTAQANRMVHDNRTGQPSLDGDDEWTLGMNLSLPLFTGGSRSSRVLQAEITLDQLELQRADVRSLVDQRIRSNLHQARASYLSIDLKRTATEAARRNLELVSASYRQGIAGIIELLDAQNAAITAELAATNASYDFLLDLMNLERSVGGFEFLLDNATRQAILDAATTLGDRP